METGSLLIAVQNYKNQSYQIRRNKIARVGYVMIETKRSII